MTVMVIDASLVLAVVLPDENSQRADAAMDVVTAHGAWAPTHWPLEVANGLLIAERRLRVGSSLRRAALRDLAALAITLDNDTSALAWSETSDLAARHKLTVYDAAYLELARRRRLPLATLDGDLIKAAAAEKVPVFGEP